MESPRKQAPQGGKVGPGRRFGKWGVICQPWTGNSVKGTGYVNALNKGGDSSIATKWSGVKQKKSRLNS